MKALAFYGRFLPSFTRIGFFARGLSARPVVADLAGQTWLVTGATAGIGRAVALGAARRGARVLAVGRNADALAVLAAAGGTGLILRRHDLARVGDNLALAEAAPSIDVLVNNVGILNHDHVVTSEGFEQSYATNLLGPFALTERLVALGKLDGGLVVNVASGGLYNAPLNLPMLDQAAGRFNGVAAYASHKRAQLALSDHWTLPTRDITAHTMHPGWVATEGVRVALPRMDKLIGPILRSTDEGADTILWLGAVRPEAQPGRLWFDRKARGAHVFARTCSPLTTPQALVAKLQQDIDRVQERPA